MDGSEPGDITPAAVLSGAPVELQARTVRYVFIRISLIVLQDMKDLDPKYEPRN